MQKFSDYFLWVKLKEKCFHEKKIRRKHNFPAFTFYKQMTGLKIANNTKSDIFFLPIDQSEILMEIFEVINLHLNCKKNIQ